MGDQPALLDRAVGHDRHPVTRKPRYQVVFRATPGKVVEDLVGLTACAAARDEFLHVVGVEIADAPAQDLARRDQPLHGLDRLGERNIAAPVQEIQVEPVGAQPSRLASHARGSRSREAFWG